MARHNELGKAGEQKAVEYLLAQGYRVLDRNWKAPHSRHELDIVAMDKDCIVIVEVKTRSTRQYGDPIEAVNWQKVRALTSAANSYVRIKRIDIPLRFDIIGIVNEEIVHVKKAFVPPARYY